MKRVAFAFGGLSLFAIAAAQEADPARGYPAAPASGPSELDILSEGVNADFPDIDAVKARKPVSVTLRALDKVTAKYSDLVIDIGETAKFGGLELTPRYCDKRPPEEFPETTAFVEIADRSAKQKSDYRDPALDATKVASVAEAAPAADALPEGVIFSGWMFKSSPALNGVEHPVYDVWVIDCKTVNVDN